MRKRQWLVLGVLLTVAAGVGAAWFWRAPALDWLSSRFPKIIPAGIVEPKPDPATYRTLKRDLEAKRAYLSRQYQSAATPAAREAILQQARQSLETTLPAMMRCWLGTPWDFNGTAAEPGAGKIACGYFVATVLKDAGFRVDRYTLARQASGNILQSFLPRDACVLMVGKPYAEFTAAIAKREPGVYVIGLDSHVAFLVVTREGFRFVHSSGARPWRVVDESPADAGVLQRSNWRMFGNLTEHPKLLQTWLEGRTITVKGNE